jgi:hypothetical protein
MEHWRQVVAKYRFNKYEMYSEGKSKLWSLNTSYCLIEVVTKAGPTVFPPSIYSYLADMIVHPVLTTAI